jgi:hypothetical protein
MEAELLARMAEYFGSDIRRINHAMKVYAFAKMLSAQLPDKQRETLLVAAIFHDIGIKNAELRHHSAKGEYQQLEGPPVARGILEAEKVPEETIERVCYLIANHHNYDKIEGDDFQILVEADLIVNCYEDHLPSVAVKSVKDKYFRTQAGKHTLTELYGV